MVIVLIFNGLLVAKAYFVTLFKFLNNFRVKEFIGVSIGVFFVQTLESKELDRFTGTYEDTRS